MPCQMAPTITHRFLHGMGRQNVNWKPGDDYIDVNKGPASLLIQTCSRLIASQRKWHDNTNPRFAYWVDSAEDSPTYAVWLVLVLISRASSDCRGCGRGYSCYWVSWTGAPELEHLRTSTMTDEYSYSCQHIAELGIGMLEGLGSQAC
jgi:hypothetical protein